MIRDERAGERLAEKRTLQVRASPGWSSGWKKNALDGTDQHQRGEEVVKRFRHSRRFDLWIADFGARRCGSRSTIQADVLVALDARRAEPLGLHARFELINSIQNWLSSASLSTIASFENASSARRPRDKPRGNSPHRSSASHELRHRSPTHRFVEDVTTASCSGWRTPCPR